METRATVDNPPQISIAYPMTERSIRWLSIVGVLGLTILTAYLLVYKLDSFPAPQFDEGAFLKVAKNFATNGIYADFSQGENRYTGAVVSTGPTVILPVAFIFKLAGVSIMAGRLVAVGYTLLMLVAMYLLCTQLIDQALHRDERGQRGGVLLVFLVISVGEFLVSIGWPRYAVPVQMLSLFPSPNCSTP